MLSGVLIYAASKIYGRKVDYLEQEIIGIAKNFEAVENADEKQPEKEMKKTRTKKFVIKDSVNLDKITFEEKPINVLTKIDINKTLALPSKINRLQKMKEFFAKSKSKNGKLVIPKNLLFTNDYVVSNFGSTQIYDYDDNKDIVGSRRDFTAFSYYINACTGELQSDICVNSSNESDFHIENRENVVNLSRPVSPDDRGPSPMDWETRPDTPEILEEPAIELTNQEPVKDFSDNLSINIDEGIEMDENEKANMLLPSAQPSVNVMDIIRGSPNLFPADPQINDSFEIANFEAKPPEDSQRQTKEQTPEVQIKNIFMIPLKKLKHRCLFELPNEEFGELKRRKKDENKSSVVDGSVRQMKIFNPFELMRLANISCHPEDPPFLGFTIAQQNEPMTYFSYRLTQKPQISPRDRSRSLIDVARKYSNDSGLDADCRENTDGDCSTETVDASLTENQTIDPNSSGDQSTTFADQSTINSDQTESSPNTTNLNQTPSTTLCNNSSVYSETDNNLNISGGDSCYQSLASGDSTKVELSSFFKDIESRNETINESESCNEDDGFNESEERILQMQQSANNVS